MARLARVVVPGYPHHITQRGNRNQQTFFKSHDFQTYRKLIIKNCNRHDVQIWAYCLMPNHIHLIAVPASEDGLRRAIGETHRTYTLLINARHNWQGHLWQGRFCSVPMDQHHLLVAALYIETHPVRANLATEPSAYLWSSCRHHLGITEDSVVRHSPLNSYIDDWQNFLCARPTEKFRSALHKNTRTGRPLGSKRFVEHMEEESGRRLAPKKRGPRSRRGE